MMLIYTQIMTGLALVMILTVVIFTISKKSTLMFSKSIPFECGFVPLGNSRMPFSVQFFLISLVFLIFDVELILLFPVMVNQLNILTISLSGFLMFLVLMASGLVWEWSQGSLEWLK